MADAVCGPSNPLQNLQKHTSADRTLQQDRLVNRQSPAQVRAAADQDGFILTVFRASDHKIPIQARWMQNSKHSSMALRINRIPNSNSLALSWPPVMHLNNHSPPTPPTGQPTFRNYNYLGRHPCRSNSSSQQQVKVGRVSFFGKRK